MYCTFLLYSLHKITFLYCLLDNHIDIFRLFTYFRTGVTPKVFITAESPLGAPVESSVRIFQSPEPTTTTVGGR